MHDHWEHFDHGADVGVRGIGASKAAAFVQAALSLTAVVTDPAVVEPREAVAIECEGEDDEALLVAWLNALLYEMAVRRMLFGRFDLRLEDGRLHATAHGEGVSTRRHRPAVEVRGATHTALSVARRENGDWLAQTVVDV